LNRSEVRVVVWVKGQNHAPMSGRKEMNKRIRIMLDHRAIGIGGLPEAGYQK
jgi:hypothetical protein